MNHVFHPDAALEFEEAVRYYRARGRMLGDRFAAEVRFAIRRILETPERWPAPATAKGRRNVPQVENGRRAFGL